MTRLTILAVSVSLFLAPAAFARLFRTATGYPTGQLPASVVVQDFNNDHVADIATANSNDGNVSVLLGNPDGTFGPTNSFAVGAGAEGIASGDFNGDGKNDLVVTDGIKSAYISLGNGDGTFAPATTIKLRTGTAGIVVADLNGDGKADIAIAILGPENNSQGSVALLLGRGDGTFAPAVFYDLNHNAVRLVAADLNGDGKLDLAVALQHFSSPKNGLAVLLGNGDGTFQAATTSVSGDQSDITAADFNGDGKLDLALAPSYSSVIEILIGNGDGTFAPAVDYPAGTGGYVVATDLSGDGKLDLLVGGGHTATLFGNGDGTFGPPTVYAIGQGFAVPGFFNRDHFPDVVAEDFNGVNVAFGNRDGTFRAGLSYPAGYSAKTIVSSDFNGDGHADLAVSGSSFTPTIAILLGDGAGRFATGTDFGTVPANFLCTADLNNDGKADLLGTGYNGGSFQVYLGNGDGTFASALNTSAPGSELWPAIGDLNHDGFPDVILADLFDNVVHIYLGNGDGTFHAVGDLPTGDIPESPLITDFNGDGNPDIAIFNSFGNSFEIYLGKGDGTFQTAISISAPGGAGNSAAADINGDGKIDLVVSTSGLSLFLGKGDGTFQPPQILSANSGAPRIADIDGDGHLDIATTSEFSSIEVLRGDGQGGFKPPLSFPIGSEFVGGFVLQDFNGDGHPDLAATNIADAVAVILNTNRRQQF